MSFVADALGVGDFLGDIFGTALGGALGFALGGFGGALIGMGAYSLLEGTIEGGIITGRLFTNPMGWLVEPLRPVCRMLGINDKDVISGSYSVVKIFHENQYPNTLVKNCIMRNKDGTGLIKYFYDFSKIGTAQFDKLFYIGRKQYIDYLPDTYLASSTADPAVIKQALDKAIHDNSNVQSYYVGLPSNMTWAEWTLQEQGLYKYSTDIVTIDTKEYRIASAEYNTTTGKIDLTLKSQNPAYGDTTKTIDAPLGESYYSVVYTTESDPTPKVWLHSIRLSDLDINFTNDDPNKMYKAYFNCLPMVCIRNDKHDLVDAKDSTETEGFMTHKRYKSTNKLLKAVGLTLEDLTKGYHENSQIKDVYDAYFVVGVSPKQTLNDAEKDPKGNKYSIESVASFLYQTVIGLYRKVPCLKAGQTYFLTVKESPLSVSIVWAGNPIQTIDGRKVINNEKIKVGHYSMELADRTTKHYRVILQKLNEYLGPKEVTYYSYDIDGYVTGSTTVIEYEYKAVYLATDLNDEPITPQKVLDAIDNAIPYYPERGNRTVGFDPISYPTNVLLDEELDVALPYFRIMKTVTVSSYDSETGTSSSSVRAAWKSLIDMPLDTVLETEDYCTIYSSPSELVLIYQKSANWYYQVRLSSLTSCYATESVDQGLVTAATVDEDNFLFPVTYNALKLINVYNKTKFISESLYLIFFAKKSQHLDFYQTEEFGTFLQIVGIVITVVIQIFTWWSGPSGSVTAQAVIQSIIAAIAVYVGVTLALQIIAAFVPDSTLKAILSAAVMVVGVAVGGGFSNINWGTAVQLAEIAVKSVDIYTNDQMKYAQQDMIDLQTRYKEAKQKIDEAYGQLGQGLDSSEIITTQALTREWGGRLTSRDEYFMLALTCPDLYSVCQDQIDLKKTTDLDIQYPLYDM